MKNNKKNLKFFTKHWITLWLVIVSVPLLAVIISFASYTDTNKRIKRVFVASKQISVLFTSNYLVSGTNHKSICFNEDDLKKFTVLLRNYDPSDPTQVNGTMTYSLNAVLSHNNCSPYAGTDAETAALQAWTDGEMSIVISDGTNTMTLSGDKWNDSINAISLPDTNESGTGSGVRNVHEWEVTFTNIPLDSDYCVTLTATPSNGNGAITATLDIASFPDSEHDGWDCFIADDTSQDINSFDAFNYIITGSGGTTLKFSYDATKLEVNPVFSLYNSEATLQNSYQGSVDGTHTGWKTIEITVNPTVHRYDLQMYKYNSSVPDNWNVLKPENKSWVEFEVVQPAPNPEPEQAGGD